MSDLVSLLPQPRHQSDQDLVDAVFHVKRTGQQIVSAAKRTVKDVPPYGERQGFIPRALEDFGNGGAFPEIHIAQYPLDMGREQGKGKTVALTLSTDGKVDYDNLLHQRGQKKNVFSKSSDLVEYKGALEPELLLKPSEEEEIACTEKTKEALDKLVNGKIATARPKQLAEKKAPAQYVRYTPQQSAIAGAPEAQQRIVRIVEAAKDPLDPSTFRVKKVPAGASSPPVPVMHSPPRKLTKEEVKDWYIPPSVSNWENRSGFTIALDKRLAADGRNLIQPVINPRIAEFSKVLHAVERKAAEDIKFRKQIQQQLAEKQRQEKDQKLAELASQARSSRFGSHYASFDPSSDLQSRLSSDVPFSDDRETGVKRERDDDDRDDERDYDRRRNRDRDEDDRHSHHRRRRGESDSESESDSDSDDGEDRRVKKEVEERDRLREQRRRDLEREMRLENLKAKGGRRMQDRDISEQIALGGKVTVGTSGESLFDQRLFNQSQGLDNGFGAEDSYNAFDKPLFGATSSQQLFRPQQDQGDLFGEEQLEQLMKTKRFRPDQGFKGTDTNDGPSRDGRPLQFERSSSIAPSSSDPSSSVSSRAQKDDDDDVFAFNDIIGDARSGRAQKMDAIISKGTMNPSGAGNYETYASDPNAPLRTLRFAPASSSASSLPPTPAAPSQRQPDSSDSQHSDRNRDKETERHRDHDRDRDRDRDRRSRDSDRDRDRHRSSRDDRDHDRHSDRHRDSDRDRDRDRHRREYEEHSRESRRERDRHREHESSPKRHRRD